MAAENILQKYVRVDNESIGSSERGHPLPADQSFRQSSEGSWVDQVQMSPNGKDPVGAEPGSVVSSLVFVHPVN